MLVVSGQHHPSGYFTLGLSLSGGGDKQVYFRSEVRAALEIGTASGGCCWGGGSDSSEEQTSVWILKEVEIKWQGCEGSTAGGLKPWQGSRRGPGVSLRGQYMPARECRFPPEAEGSWGKIFNMVRWRSLSPALDGECLEGSDVG